MTHVVITGATSGIGKEIARALAQRGARLTLLARDEARGAAAAEELGGADVVRCDLAELASVRAAAEELPEAIDVLVLNAGVRTLRAQTSADGYELMTATNHLGPFLLTNLVLDRVKERIVVTASEAHRTGNRIALERLGAPEHFGPSRSERPYGRSKLFNVLFTQELAERLDGVTANCFCPGVVGTDLIRDSPLISAAGRIASRTPFIRRPEQGARMGVRLVVDPDERDRPVLHLDPGPALSPARSRPQRPRLPARAVGAQRRARGAVMTVHGRVEPGLEPVRELFGQLFASPGRGGGSLVVRRGDDVLVDLWGGLADPRTGRPWQRDSLGLSFSTSKGVAATIVHRLADRGLIDYDEPVATYWPAFAAQGKGPITVRQLLSHQAGLDDITTIAPRIAALLDHAGCEERLAASAPAGRPGTPAYHAITFGWLVAGLARAVTGRGMDELLDSEVNEPLGIDGLHFGMPRSGAEHVPALVGGLGRLAALGPRAAAFLPGFIPTRRALRSVSVSGFDEIFKGAEPKVLQTVMPAVNGMFTAESLATLYAALANGGMADGRRLLSAATVNALGRVQTTARDGNLIVPMRWRLGYHQAFIPRMRLPRAFGHYGYAGSGAWADPVSGLSVAFVSNRVYGIHEAFGDFALMRLSRATVTAARASARPAAGARAA